MSVIGPILDVKIAQPALEILQVFDFSDLFLNNITFPSEIAFLVSLRKLNFRPIVFEGSLPLNLCNLTNLEEFHVTVQGPDSTYRVDEIIASWLHLEELSIELSFSSTLPDFDKLTNLKQLDVVNNAVYVRFKFPDIQKLTQLGMSFCDWFVNFSEM
jgi:hypothetical protein